MIRAIAYDSVNVRGMEYLLITCEEGTAWMVEAEYTEDTRRPLYCPYTGYQVKLIERLGAMESIIELP